MYEEWKGNCIVHKQDDSVQFLQDVVGTPTKWNLIQDNAHHDCKLSNVERVRLFRLGNLSHIVNHITDGNCWTSILLREVLLFEYDLILVQIEVIVCEQIP